MNSTFPVTKTTSTKERFCLFPDFQVLICNKIPEEYEISFTDPNNIIFDWDPDTSLLKAFTCIAGFLSTLLGVWGIFYLFDIKSYKPSVSVLLFIVIGLI